jgi:hypothetical protein
MGDLQLFVAAVILDQASAAYTGKPGKRRPRQGVETSVRRRASNVWRSTFNNVCSTTTGMPHQRGYVLGQQRGQVGCVESCSSRLPRASPVCPSLFFDSAATRTRGQVWRLKQRLDRKVICVFKRETVGCRIPASSGRRASPCLPKFVLLIPRYLTRPPPFASPDKALPKTLFPAEIQITERPTAPLDLGSLRPSGHSCACSRALP